jgi:hypothetical protein
MSLPAVGMHIMGKEDLPDAGAFDPVTRTLTQQPVGWTISNYSGTADGRDEFRGYLGHRRGVPGEKEMRGTGLVCAM